MPYTRVLAAVVRRHNQYLICQRPVHKRHGGLWEFPGGKAEAGETHFSTAHRELTEELGVIVIAVGSPLFAASDPGSEFLIEFIPTEIQGEPQCLEHLELRWLSVVDLLLLPLAPSDRRFVEFLSSRTVNR